ncbi:hypothetical protein F4680DRAFT_206817 [Xylaria scruposa]|nr:hypothetical protein F4680DRAFT_206817 [Xylaria scruposa]
MNFFVQSPTGRRSYTLRPEDTVESMRQRIGKDLSLDSTIKICFPGMNKEIRDQDSLLSHFPNGVTVNVAVESDLENDSENESKNDGKDTSGDGQRNDLDVVRNRAQKKARQSNLIIGVNQQARGRATKAHIAENEAVESSYQSNAILSSMENYREFKDRSAM